MRVPAAAVRSGSSIKRGWLPSRSKVKLSNALTRRDLAAIEERIIFTEIKCIYASLHKINVVGEFDPESTAIAYDITPLVTEVGNDVVALARELKAPVGLENGGGKIEFGIAARDEGVVVTVAHTLEVGGGDVSHGVAAASEEHDSVTWARFRTGNRE
jgi:hypothetical protein